ncbi:cellulose binding domain-containing protein [Actinoplanes sp. NPDC023801]|uniref:cellulose binding domain-containing protein n=1 Tax=Actinoplanes sp. NPDC023801 TaxID=3154595 RepID=UPI0033DC7DCD
MAKHAVRQFILARLVLGSAAAVLAALVVWVAVVAGGSAGAGEPLLVQPSAALQAAGDPLPATTPSTESAPVPSSPTPSASVSSSASQSPSASASFSPSAKPKPSKTPSRTPSTRPSPSPAANTLAVTYATSAAWRDGFIAAVKVVNNGSAAREWTVTLTYPSSADVEVRGGWNATVSASGDTVTIRGNSLAAGASITAGFQGSKDIGAVVKPVTCAVGGGSCGMS